MAAKKPKAKTKARRVSGGAKPKAPRNRKLKAARCAPGHTRSLRVVDGKWYGTEVAAAAITEIPFEADEAEARAWLYQ